MSEPAAGPSDVLLLVDDNPAMLQLLREMLGGRGYDLVTALNGREGFTAACERQPTLILLDVDMPIQNGFETCRALKADPRTRESAVIFLSARDEVEDKVQGLELGAVDYISKPFQMEEVIARVNTQMSIRRLNRELQLRWEEIDRELRVVQDEQRHLLPRRLPEIPGLALAAFYTPSRYAGGDYYDVVELPDGRWGILMADAAGHGTPAAVLMAMTYAVFHAYPGPGTAPDEVLAYLNKNLARFCHDTFVTALYGVYDAPARLLRFASAGHMPPILYRPAEGAARECECEGIFPLGMVPDWDAVPVYSQGLLPGDRLLFYTDGIMERFNPRQEMYGLSRLLARLAEEGGKEPSAALDSLVADVERFAQGRAAHDDQTMLLAIVV